MKVEAKALGNNKVEVQVECTEEQVALALEQSYKKIVKGISIPGFRKGKAPRAILEMRYGAEILYDDAIEFLLPEVYEAALQAAEIEPIDRPEVEIVSFAKDQPAAFKFTVQGPPEVTLGQYQGIEVEKVSFPVKEEDVELALQQMQEQQARLVESPADTIAEGDFVTLDYKGFVDGEAFAGGQAEDYTLQIGSNTFIPGFEDQLIGLGKNTTAEIDVVFPDEYHSEELAGQAAVFKVNIKDVKQKQVPALDDDFAAEVSEFDTLEELRQDVENKLQEAAAQRERNAFESSLLETVVANAQVDIPDVMVEQETNEMVEELVYNMLRQGFPEELAREYVASNADKMRDEYREAALARVKTRLVIQQIKEAEAIAATEEELSAKVQEMADLYQQDADVIKQQLEKQGSLDILRNNIAMEKTIQFLVESAVPVEPVSPEENSDLTE